MTVRELAIAAKVASRDFRNASTCVKNQALLEISNALTESADDVLQANAQDLANARANGIRDALIDRLTLTKGRIEGIAQALIDIIALPDPIGQVDFGTTRPNGLAIQRVRVPLGLVAILYEARPNVTVDAAALCLKSGNACLLRGGKEAIHTNKALVKILQAALVRVGLNPALVTLIEDTNRDSALEMMRLNGVVDVLIPRGGASLIRAAVENATVPVIETGVGNCHLYVEQTADPLMAVNLLDNAKTSRPSVCNAVETVLVDRAIAPVFLPMAKAQLDEHHVQWRGCAETIAILGDCVTPATESDYEEEFGDYILACRVVSDTDDALAHIARYGTGHSEAIVTNDYQKSQRFLAKVDAACVYVNASTRFTDGQEFGFGAEIGISTQKLHARGPMGLNALTTNQYRVLGNGQTR